MGMNRREFLKAAAGIAATVALPAAAVTSATKAVATNPLFTGELGCWSGVRFIESFPKVLPSASLLSICGIKG